MRKDDLMPPDQTLPPLEKETYIPPNQLELDWDSDYIHDENNENIVMDDDSRDMTINSLRQSLQDRDKEIEDLRNTLGEIAKLMPSEFWPARYI